MPGDAGISASRKYRNTKQFIIDFSNINEIAEVSWLNWKIMKHRRTFGLLKYTLFVIILTKNWLRSRLNSNNYSHIINIHPKVSKLDVKVWMSEEEVGKEKDT